MLRGDLEKRQQSGVRLRGDVSVDRRGIVGLIGIVEQHEAAVSTYREAGNRARRLRDHALTSRAVRKLRRGGEVGQRAQHECGGGVRVAVRQTSDGGRRSCNERAVPHEDS